MSDGVKYRGCDITNAASPNDDGTGRGNFTIRAESREAREAFGKKGLDEVHRKISFPLPDGPDKENRALNQLLIEARKVVDELLDQR